MAESPSAVIDPPVRPMSYPDLLRALGFDPDVLQAVVVTPTSAVGISHDYPEPTNPPAPDETPEPVQEATDGE